MQSELSFSTSSICDIAKDEIVVKTGHADRLSDGTLFVPTNSSLSFQYYFNYATNVYKPVALRLLYEIVGGVQLKTRYSSALSIQIDIVYWTKDTETGNYVTGSSQRLTIYPFLMHEGVDLNTLDIETKGLLVRSISITFSNSFDADADADIVIKGFTILKGMSLQDTINSSYGLAIMLNNVVSHPNGLEVYYSGEQPPLTFIRKDDGTGRLSGIWVNKGQDGEKFIGFKESDVLLGE